VSLAISGGFGEGETPLPIPNRAVKPLSADGTWPARAWESRTPPVLLSASPARMAGLVAVHGLHPVRRDSRSCGAPAGCEPDRRPASQRQRRPASARLQGADRTNGVMQCCGRASTAPPRRRARAARSGRRCGWDVRESTSSSASSMSGSRSRAERARSNARCAALSGNVLGVGRQNTCSYGVALIGWKCGEAVVGAAGSQAFRPTGRLAELAAATGLAEQVFVSLA
jgi:hypothetical protein